MVKGRLKMKGGIGAEEGRARPAMGKGQETREKNARMKGRGRERRCALDKERDNFGRTDIKRRNERGIRNMGKNIDRGKTEK